MDAVVGPELTVVGRDVTQRTVSAGALQVDLAVA